ncbi:hypothetical protein AC578_6509 [Pseudocercospora eumusae]|uniref:Uncharacterized protein n=1 Tax=Pseudocercospora eumusae TaxID=321146 RepID=A0A139HHS9_9PEZI|nr:hypothetical protein AC578_6509 [Pseudocercospora eumusae]
MAGSAQEFPPRVLIAASSPIPWFFAPGYESEVSKDIRDILAAAEEGRVGMGLDPDDGRMSDTGPEWLGVDNRQTTNWSRLTTSIYDLTWAPAGTITPSHEIALTLAPQFQWLFDPIMGRLSTVRLPPENAQLGDRLVFQLMIMKEVGLFSAEFLYKNWGSKFLSP